MLHESLELGIASDNLCLKLASTALDSLVGGPMESALLPLTLFNDAARLAKSMQASYLVPALTSQANQTLDTILGMIALKVATVFVTAITRGTRGAYLEMTSDRKTRFAPRDHLLKRLDITNPLRKKASVSTTPVGFQIVWYAESKNDNHRQISFGNTFVYIHPDV